MIPLWIWSYVLCAGTSLGLWLVGSRHPIGWVLALATQIVWVAYSIVTSQYGFLISAIVHAVVYWRNYKVEPTEVTT